jgi:hypothetical protein
VATRGLEGRNRLVSIYGVDVDLSPCLTQTAYSLCDGFGRAEQGDPMTNGGYYWDVVRPELCRLFTIVWGEPTVGLNRRQSTATVFAMRALRRVAAVDALFKAGLYLESHALVRAAYEDWLKLAYVLREPGDSRCDELAESIHKLDARVFDAFKVLCGQTVADKLFGPLPPLIQQYVGLARSETQPPAFASMADECRLRSMHDFVYAYLSGISHPDARTERIFDSSDSIPVAVIPERDAAQETRLAVWFCWFAGRTEILASKEFGVDHESFVDEYLLPLLAESGLNLETCVFVRES